MTPKEGVRHYLQRHQLIPACCSLCIRTFPNDGWVLKDECLSNNSSPSSLTILAEVKYSKDAECEVSNVHVHT